MVRLFLLSVVALAGLAPLWIGVAAMAQPPAPAPRLTVGWVEEVQTNRYGGTDATIAFETSDGRLIKLVQPYSKYGLREEVAVFYSPVDPTRAEFGKAKATKPPSSDFALWPAILVCFGAGYEALVVKGFLDGIRPH